MKINCVILNYNDVSTVLELVKEIGGYQELDRIVVVDNASSDDSWERLQILKEQYAHVDLLRSEKNGGYRRRQCRRWDRPRRSPVPEPS